MFLLALQEAYCVHDHYHARLPPEPANALRAFDPGRTIYLEY